MSRLTTSLLALALITVAPGCKGASDEAEGGTGTETGDPPLPPELDPVTTVAEILVPFDVSREDLVGPGSWATNYGKSPEIIVAPDGAGGLAVLAQDYTNPDEQHAWLLRIQPSLTDYVITAAVEPPMLDRIMGVAVDDAGMPFVASGIVEALHQELSTDYPAPGEYRSGIVRVVSLDWDGAVNFDVDLDLARQAFDAPELLINPMVAATSRMAYGAGTLALVHGINTDPDDAEVRHQKAIATHLDANTGAITRTSSIWVSHSFDQRIWHDGQGFIEAHLGDAYPRHIAFARVSPDSSEYPLFHVKGPTGENVTRTLLGDVAPIVDDPVYGYIALFVTERGAGFDAVEPMHETIASARELAMVRVQRDFETHSQELKNELPHLDPALPHTQAVESGDNPRTNKLRWLSDYEAEGAGTIHAERPKLVAIGGDRYIALWERWQLGGEVYAFTGTQAMVIDAQGEVLVGPSSVSSAHLPRGDDAFGLERGAAWMTGDSEARALHLHIVDDQLDTRSITIE